MKTFRLITVILLVVFSLSLTAKEKKCNTLTKKEKKSGWVLAFDGKSTDSWRGYNKPGFPEKGWEIVDGTIHCKTKGGGGDIIFDKKLTNFEFSIDWKIAEGGNSGIFIFGREIEGKPIYFSAPEYQLLDNERHPDAKAGKNDNRKSASLYDMIPANPQNCKPAGEWNEAKIVAKNGKIEFWQNNVKVVEFDMKSDNWKVLCLESKFKNWPDFVNNSASDGYIGLQDHGDEIWFKNIKIKEL